MTDHGKCPAANNRLICFQFIDISRRSDGGPELPRDLGSVSAISSFMFQDISVHRYTRFFEVREASKRSPSLGF